MHCNISVSSELGNRGHKTHNNKILSEIVKQESSKNGILKHLQTNISSAILICTNQRALNFIFNLSNSTSDQALL